MEWCKSNAVTFTRSREYKKNDQAHVEEKNGSVVRRLIGYDRYEGIRSWQLLSSLYRIYRLYVNFFQPSLKLVSKSRDGARVHRRYEQARTPFERVLESTTIQDDIKERLRHQFNLLDPVLLLSEIERLQNEFWRTAVTDCTDDQSLHNERIETPPEPQSEGIPSTESAPPPRPRRKRSDKPATSVTSAGERRGRKSNVDEVWSEVCKLLEEQPTLTRTEILRWLELRYPNRFRQTQINTIGEKLKRWRDEHYPGRNWDKSRPGKKTDIDDVWTEICAELEKDPLLTTRGIMRMLCQLYPDKFRMTQRSTLVNKLNAWRKDHIQRISIAVDDPKEAAAAVLHMRMKKAGARMESGRLPMEI